MEEIRGQKFTVRHNSPLLDYLHELFPQQSNTGIKAYLSNGQIMINGRKTTAFDYPLQKDDKLVVLPKKVSLSNEIKHAARVSVKDLGIEILYEDDYIIVINKKSGLPVVGTGKSMGKSVNIDKKGGKASLLSQHKETTAYSILCDYTRTKVHAERMGSSVKLPWKPSHVYIVHRIDRDTSGVLVFAKSEKIQKIMQDGWNGIVKDRGYTGVVEGAPSDRSGTVTSWLKENPKSRKMMSSKTLETKDIRSKEGWLKAVTKYDVLRSGEYSLLEFHLETGRKNQIRVQMAEESGCPIAGDKKYGARTSPLNRLALHAHLLSFVHPISGKVMTFTAPVPKSFYNITGYKDNSPR